ncbi:MAG TPA: DedA family protein [Patescibacteria group bacterium]|jgi:membrane-associated protein|nr:DedA family protein [Patescibacteria group bacterium]
MFDLVNLLKTVGYLGLFGIIFAETGLLFGFFLPGDSLLFTAGILSAQGFLNPWIVVIGLFIAVLAGDNTGYLIGRKLGPKIFKKEDSLLFKKSHLEKAHAFFEKHGSKTVILARFVPVVRTFSPTLAGVGKMRYSTFLSFSIVGSLLWSTGLTLLGYYLGVKIPNIDRYLLPIIGVIIIVSISPYLYKFARSKEVRTAIHLEIKKLFGK